MYWQAPMLLNISHQLTWTFRLRPEIYRVHGAQAWEICYEGSPTGQKVGPCLPPLAPYWHSRVGLHPSPALMACTTTLMRSKTVKESRIRTYRLDTLLRSIFPWWSEKSWVANSSFSTCIRRPRDPVDHDSGKSMRQCSKVLSKPFGLGNTYHALLDLAWLTIQA